MSVIVTSVTSLTETCYAVFDWCPLEVFSFLKRSRGGMDLEERGGRVNWRRGIEENCNGDIMYERRKN